METAPIPHRVRTLEETADGPPAFSDLLVGEDLRRKPSAFAASTIARSYSA
jgi:hypothetical protein